MRRSNLTRVGRRGGPVWKDDMGQSHDWLKDHGHESHGEGRFQTMGVPMQIGDKVLIETVTKYYTGEVAEVDFDWIVLVKAAWIPDTGRLHLLFRNNGAPQEVEPYPDDYRLPIQIGNIVTAGPYPHALPRGVV